MCSFAALKLITEMKRKILLAITCVFMTALIASADNRHEAGLKVLYWNIQNGMWDGQADNYCRFTDWVASRKPDICVWAEAQSIFRTGTGVKMAPEDRYLTDGWAELAARYGHRYIYIGGHRDNYPQVVTSRFPISDAGRFTDEVKDSTVAHGSGWAKINVRGHELNIVTVHTWPQRFSFEYNGKSPELQKQSAARNGGDLYRLKEMTYICNNTVLADKDAESHLWLMLGDFNSISSIDNDVYDFPADSSCFILHDYIRHRTPYIDSVKEHNQEFSWTTFSKLRYDYMYMTPALDALVKKASVIYDDYTMPVSDPQVRGFCHPSDHLPLEAIFEI